jgi:hypothetical protein
MSTYPTGFQNSSMNPTPSVSVDTIGSWTGYNAPMYGGVPYLGGSYNFTNPQYPVTSQSNFSSPMPQQSGGVSAAGGGAAGGMGSMNPATQVLGAFQIAQGTMGMKQLEKQKFPEYTASPELSRAKTRSGQMANMGFTPEQRAQFNFTLGQATNQDYRNAIDLAGGNLSGALNARRSGMRLGAINQFAQQDAQQRMSNIRYDDSMTDKVQRLRDNNTQIALNRRMALEQAYGNAIKTGTENVVNSFDMGQAMKMMAGGM